MSLCYFCSYKPEYLHRPLLLQLRNSAMNILTPTHNASPARHGFKFLHRFRSWTTTSHYLHRLFVPMEDPIELRSNSFLCLGCIAHFHSLILQVCDTCSAPSPPVSCLALGQTFHVPAPREVLYLDVLLCKTISHQHINVGRILEFAQKPRWLLRQFFKFKKFFQILKFDSYPWF